MSERLAFIFHAANYECLPVPASLGARLLRQAVYVDAELTRSMLRAQLVHRVMLFVPEDADGPSGVLAGGGRARGPRPLIAKLSTRLEATVDALVGAVTPPQGATATTSKEEAI